MSTTTKTAKTMITAIKKQAQNQKRKRKEEKNSQVRWTGDQFTGMDADPSRCTIATSTAGASVSSAFFHHHDDGIHGERSYGFLKTQN